MYEQSDQAGSPPEKGVPRLGRRAWMLRAAAAAGAGAAVSLVSGVGPAEAQDADVILNETNIATGTTTVNTSGGNGLQGGTTNNASSGVAGFDTSSAGGYGVYGSSTRGLGVFGTSTDNDGMRGATSSQANSGVSGFDNSGGTNSHGVYGTSDNGSGVYGTSGAGTGVYGTSDNIGVYGTSGGGGQGVCGSDYPTGTCTGVFASVQNPSNASAALNAQTGGTGVAVQASILNAANSSPALSVTTNGSGPAVSASTTGTGPALAVDGVVTFSRSGTATVKGTSSSPAASVTVTGIALTESSVILATPQAKVSGVAVEAVVTDVAKGSFAISLTKAVKVPVPIAWLVIG